MMNTKTLRQFYISTGFNSNFKKIKKCINYFKNYKKNCSTSYTDGG